MAYKRSYIYIYTNFHLHPHEYVVQLLHGERMNEYVLRKMMLTFQWRQVNEWICLNTFYLSKIFNFFRVSFVGSTHSFSNWRIHAKREYLYTLLRSSFVDLVTANYWNYNFLFIHKLNQLLKFTLVALCANIIQIRYSFSEAPFHDGTKGGIIGEWHHFWRVRKI